MKLSKLILISVLFTFSFGAIAQQSEEFLDMSLEDLMNVKVTAASKSEEMLKDAPGIVTVISRKDIELYASKSLGELLSKAASFQFMSSNFYQDQQMIIRGQSFTPYDNHVLILLNGRPLRDPISGGLNMTIYNSFPLDAIEQVEIIRGPGSVLYGSCAYSGVINLVTRRAYDEGSEFKVTARAGSFGTTEEIVTAVAQKNDLQVSFSLLNGHSFGERLEFADYAKDTSLDYFFKYQKGVFANAEYKNLRLNAAYLFINPRSLEGADMIWEHPYKNKESHATTFFDVGYTVPLSNSASIDFSTTYNDHDWNSADGMLMHGSALMGEATLKAKYRNNFNLVAGGIFEYDAYDGTALADENTNSFSVYAQADYKPLKFLKLIGGAQINKIKGIDANVSPRAGVIGYFAQSSTREFGFKLLYSEAFRKGYPFETSFLIPVIEGNLGLKPELIATAEGQLFYSTERTHLSITVFRSELSKIIVRNRYEDATKPFGFYLKYENGGKYKYTGAEVEGKILFSNKLSFQFSSTYQLNEDGAGNKNTALHPNFMLKTGLAYDDSKFFISAFNSFYSDPYSVSKVNPSVEVVNKEASAYSILTAKVGFRLNEFFFDGKSNGLLLTIEADNLLGQDIRYPEFTSKGINTFIPLKMHRSFLASLSYTF